MTKEGRKDQMVGSRLPSDLVKDLEQIEKVEQTDRSTTVRKLLYKAVKDWKLDHAARQYSEGKVTVGKAAEEAGVTVWEMLDHLRLRKIAAQYDLSDLKHDLSLVSDKAAN